MIWDPAKGFYYYDVAGERRYLARIQITPEKRASYGIKRASVVVRDPSTWTEQDFRPFAPPVKNQGSESACVGYSGTTTHQTSRAMQGMSFVDLSCGNLYGQINGGSDNGATVEDALIAMEKNGQCTTAEVPNQTWQQRHWPNNWQQVAKRYRIEIGGEVNAFEEICSDLEEGIIHAIGIDCGRDFNPDNQGVLPDQRGGGGGHGLPVLGKKLIGASNRTTFGPGGTPATVSVARVGGQWFLIIRNSWTPNWGDNGDCYMPRSYIDNAGGGHYRVIASADDPNDTLNPLPVAA